MSQYAVIVTTPTTSPGGFEGAIHSPLLFLDSTVQGIVDERHAARIVATWLESLGMPVVHTVTAQRVPHRPPSDSLAGRLDATG